MTDKERIARLERIVARFIKAHMHERQSGFFKNLNNDTIYDFKRTIHDWNHDLIVSSDELDDMMGKVPTPVVETGKT